MTREEAIQILLLRQHEAETRKILIEGTFHCKSYAREEIELYDMAITALREKEERSKVISNADSIRAMSDEELAEWIVRRTVYSESAWSAPSYLNLLTCRDDTYENALAGSIEWLKSPAKEDA